MGLRLGLPPSRQPFPSQPLKQEDQTEIQAGPPLAAPRASVLPCQAVLPRPTPDCGQREEENVCPLPSRPFPGSLSPRAGLNLLHWL